VVHFDRCIERGTVFIHYVLRVKRCSLTVWLLLEPFVCVRIRGSVSPGVNGIVWSLGGCIMAGRVSEGCQKSCWWEIVESSLRWLSFACST
jgi:hypothetical protein